MALAVVTFFFFFLEGGVNTRERNLNYKNTDLSQPITIILWLGHAFLLKYFQKILVDLSEKEIIYFTNSVWNHYIVQSIRERCDLK